MNQGFYLQDPNPNDMFNERVLRYGFWADDSGSDPAPAGEEPADRKPNTTKPVGNRKSALERVIQRLNASLTQNQFDALVSFCYNTGRESCTLYNLVKANADNPAIADEFRKWKYVGSKVVAGLVNRREAEIEFYFS